MGTMFCRTDVEVISLTRDGFNRIKGAWAENELNKKLSFLRKFSFFKGLSDSRLMSFLHLMEINTYEKKHILYSRNDKSKYLYFIFEGSVQLFTYVEDDYPIVYHNRLTRHNINPDIHKYLKNQKPRLKSVPIMILSHGSYFGQSEDLNNQEERQTMAIIESEQAIIFQIEISRFVDTMKGFNGDYDYIKDFKSKDTFQKDRIEKILDTNNQIHENILNTKKQQEFENIKKQLQQTEESEADQIIELNKNSLKNDPNNSLNVTHSNFKLEDSKDNKKSPRLSYLESQENQQHLPSLSLNFSKLQKSLNDTEECSYSPYINTTQILGISDTVGKGQINKIPQTQRLEDSKKGQINYINEQYCTEKSKSTLPLIRRKINSLNFSIEDCDKIKTIRNTQNSEVIYIDEFLRKKNQSMSQNNRSRNNSNQNKIDNQNTQSVQNNQLIYEEDKLSNSSNNKDKLYSSFNSFQPIKTIFNDGILENSPKEFMNLNSRKNSNASEFSYKNLQQKKAEFSISNKISSKFDKEYFHTFFKQKLEQIQDEKKQNLQILNYKDLDLKFIGQNPEELVQQCKKIQQFGLERGEMTGQMKKTVLCFTNRGLFSPSNHSQFMNHSRGSQSIREKNQQKLDTQTSRRDSLELNNSEQFKNSKLRFLLERDKDENFAEKCNKAMNISITRNQSELLTIREDDQSKKEEKLQLLPEIFKKIEQNETKSKEDTSLNSPRFTRQLREQMDCEMRKLEQLQRYKVMFQIDQGYNDTQEVKIKPPRIFPMKEKMHHINTQNSKEPDLFQIKKFSMKHTLENQKPKLQKNKSTDDKNKIDSQLIYFPEIQQQDTKHHNTDTRQKQEKNDSDGFIPIATVRPYYKNNPGQPKNQYTDTQEQLKEYDKLKDFFLTERRYDQQIGDDLQKNPNFQNKQQLELFQSLMLSPRRGHQQIKQFDQLKNMHIIRQKLHKQKRNKKSQKDFECEDILQNQLQASTCKEAYITEIG